MTSAFLINQMSSRVLRDKTSLSVNSHRDPYSLHPQVFECLCFVHNSRIVVKKLDRESIRVVFLGYSKKDTNTLILLMINGLFPEMLHLLNMCHFFLCASSQGKVVRSILRNKGLNFSTSFIVIAQIWKGRTTLLIKVRR